MILLIFHLSSFTFEGLDMSVASKVLKWNLKRYPNGIIFIIILKCMHLTSLPPPLSFSIGVFFLFGAGRLSLCRSQPRQAIEYYSQAMRAQSQYRNLYHISFWGMAIANLALWDVKSSLIHWAELEKESSVSEYNIQRASIVAFYPLVCVFLVVKIDLLVRNGGLFTGECQWS